MISGHGDLKTAVMAMRKGAFDYIEKPPDLNSLLSSVRESLKNKIKVKKSQLKRQNNLSTKLLVIQKNNRTKTDY